ncbi:putative leucine-rich repeat-containing protein DDB_G0290503 [Macrobrachium nipponense]|uniref:putative leucine-rich repeat-containing protein DDB_G0290503 n=1 Tax=Macrobrachium nipponense TaxID=159736 RepID=UPI0030C7C9D8
MHSNMNQLESYIVSLCGLAVGGLVAMGMEELVSCYHKFTGPNAKVGLQTLKDFNNLPVPQHFQISKYFVGFEGIVSSLAKTGGRWLSCNTVIGPGLFATSLGLFAWRKFRHHKETRQELEGLQTTRKETERDIEESSGHEEELTPRNDPSTAAVIERDLQIQDMLANEEAMKEEIENLKRKLAEALSNEADKERLLQANKDEASKLRNQFALQIKDHEDQIRDLLVVTHELLQDNERMEGQLAEVRSQYDEQLAERDHQIHDLLAEAEKMNNENKNLEDRVAEALRNKEDMERRLKDENTALRNYCDRQREENELLIQQLSKTEDDLDFMEKALRAEHAAKTTMEIQLRQDIWEGNQQLNLWIEKYEELAEEFLNIGEKLEEAFLAKDEKIERLRQHADGLREKLQEREKESEHSMIRGEQLEKEMECESGTWSSESKNRCNLEEEGETEQAWEISAKEEAEDQLEKEESDSETWSTSDLNNRCDPEEEVDTEKAREKRAKEEAEEIICMLIKKLEDLRAAKLSTFEDRHHIEGHIRKLRMMAGDEKRKEMERAWKCCLSNMEGNIKQKEEEQDEPLPHTAGGTRLPPDSSPFIDSAIPLKLQFSDKSQVPDTKFEKLNEQQREILKKEIEQLMGNKRYELLKCPPNATKEEIWLAYQSFMKDWIGKYGSFNFYSEKGYQDIKDVLLKVTSYYLSMISSYEDVEVMTQLMDNHLPTIPHVWGAMKKQKSQTSENLQMGEEAFPQKKTQTMNSVMSQSIDQLLQGKKSPAVGKSLAQWMWSTKDYKKQ